MFYTYAPNLFIGGVSTKRKLAKKSAKTRGKKKCEEIAKLKTAEKLSIKFYRSNLIGDNYDTL